MKFTIGTARLQALINKAVRGAGCNKLIPMTSLIAIKLQDGTLTVTTTDATNYLSLVEKNVVGDDFYVAVQVDLLAKLVARLTCDEVTLEVTDNSLDVIGNGKYQIELELDDEGNVVKLPNPIESFDKSNKIGEADSHSILTALTSIKPALWTTEDYPWYSCYYVSDKITATDTFTIATCSQGFLDEPKLISSIVMDLLGLFNGNIVVYATDDKILFESEGGFVYGTIPSGIENYSIEDLYALIDQKFDNSCKVVKSSLLNLLERIALFVGAYDDDKITLAFGNDGLTITSSYANEKIVYTENNGSVEFVCQTDIKTLMPIVKAQTSSEFVIEYGAENAIKIVDGDIISVVALLTED